MTQTRSSRTNTELEVILNDASTASTAISPTVSQPPRRIKKHCKVRTGCETCKTRKVKCNEARPICSNCALLTLTCVYRQQQAPYPLFVKGDTEQNVDDEMGVLRFSARDMGLMHHWIVRTADTVCATQELRRIAKEIIPEVALANPYLLHAILSVTALHVAHLHPSRRPLYQPLARHHYNISLPLFRENLPFISPTTCYALYLTSQLLVKYLFASEPNPVKFFFPSFESAPPSSSPPSSGQPDDNASTSGGSTNTTGTESMVEMLTLIKGAYIIRDTYSEWLRQGPLGALATDLLAVQQQQQSSPLLQIPTDPYFQQFQQHQQQQQQTQQQIAHQAELQRLDDHLAYLSHEEEQQRQHQLQLQPPSPNPLPTTTTTTPIIPAIRSTLFLLRHLISLNHSPLSPQAKAPPPPPSPAPKTLTKGLCTAWLAQVPTAFFDRVREHRPEALVVLAHFCVVLEEVNCDEVWYMMGWGRGLFEECVRGIGGAAGGAAGGAGGGAGGGEWAGLMGRCWDVFRGEGGGGEGRVG